MDKNNKTVITVLVIILGVLAIYYFMNNYERFDSSINGFAPFGEPQYGLRGDPLNWSHRNKYFRNDHRQIMLNQGGGELWQSNRPPTEQGLSGCSIVKCTADYDNEDTCWQCNYDPHNIYGVARPTAPFPLMCPY